MAIYAKDVMVTSFDTIHKDAPINDAISMILAGKVRVSGHKTVSLMVVDDYGQLAGVISEYDILYNLRPDFLNCNIDADSISWKGQFQILVESVKKHLVKDLMSRNVISVEPNDHIMVLLDLMIKNKHRRLPVLEQNRPMGVVYVSDVYYQIFTA